MSLLAIKAIAILVILLTALLGGWAAMRTRQSRHADRLFALGSLFGAGVFLGAGLIHVLPDSVDLFSHLYPALDYPVPFGIAALGLIAVLAVDRLGHRLKARRAADADGASAMILLVVLSFHSILAGAALGAEDSAANSIVLLLAVVAHKGSAAFALTSGLLRNPPVGRAGAPGSVRGLLFVFALMTPLGILVGTGLQEVLAGNAARVSEAVFDAFAAATFVYVATLEIIGPEFRSDERNAMKLGALTGGLAVMALVALWL